MFRFSNKCQTKWHQKRDGIGLENLFLYFCLCFPLHKDKVWSYFYICSFTETISVVPEIWSMSLQTIHQLGRKIFAWVKTTAYFKLKSVIFLERLHREEKSDMTQCIRITFSRKTIKISLRSCFSVHNLWPVFPASRLLSTLLDLVAPFKGPSLLQSVSVKFNGLGASKVNVICFFIALLFLFNFQFSISRGGFLFFLRQFNVFLSIVSTLLL